MPEIPSGWIPGGVWRAGCPAAARSSPRGTDGRSAAPRCRRRVAYFSSKDPPGSSTTTFKPFTAAFAFRAQAWGSCWINSQVL